MKSPTHLEKCIVCPKCGNKTMRKAVGKRPIGEYFDDKCHSYFTIRELVDIWGYDLGDFYSEVTTELTNVEFTHMQNSLGRNLPLSEKYFPSTPLTQEYVSARFAINELNKLMGNTPIECEDKIVATTWFDGDSVSSFVMDEPTFKSPSERLEAYEMVDRMILGILEWSMEQNEVDTGAVHV